MNNVNPMLLLANVLSIGLAVRNTCNRKYRLINFYTFCFQSDQKWKFAGVCHRLCSNMACGSNPSCIISFPNFSMLGT